MTQEEKAKRYDKALERMKSWVRGEHPECFTEAQKATEFIFPELKESEDEKIKEDLIQWISEFPDMIWRGHYKKDILAWLEKQELKEIEQKSYGQRKECLDCQFNYAGKGFVAVDNCGDKTIYNPTGRRVAFFPKKPVRDLLTDNHYWATHISPYDVIHLGYKDFPKLKWEDEPIEVKIIISTDSYCQENCKGFQETGKCFADGDCEAKREAESVDKVEPKFHEGDWIVQGYNILKIKCVGNTHYCFETVGGYVDDMLISEIDSQFHLWTIQDAKDGDVLCYKDEISLYKHDIKNCTKQEPTFGGFVYHCCYDGKRFITDSFYSLTEKDKKDIYPANKEQRDTLERAMADAGYTFDFEKKELKELGQSEVTKMSDQEEIAEIPFGAKDSELQEATYYIPKGFHAEIDDDKIVIKKGEKPTAWSEEDEQITLSIEQVMNCASLLNIVPEKMDKIRTWLKSLKGRTQPKQEWGEDKTEVVED